MPRYIAIGGVVDGRYVSPQSVQKSYGVSRVFCDYARDIAAIRGGVPKGTIILPPDPTGEYKIPTEPEAVKG